MLTVFDAPYFLDWFHSQLISFAGSAKVHSCRDLRSFGSLLADPAISDVTWCSIKCLCQTYSDTVEVLILIGNIAIEYRVVDPAPLFLSRLMYQTNKVILSTSYVLKKLQLLWSVDNCQRGSFCCTIITAVFPRWFSGREEKASSLVKIPVFWTDCSIAPCRNGAFIISPKNLWEIQQKKGHANNFDHYYDKPWDDHVPIHDDGDSGTWPLSGSRVGIQIGVFLIS